MMKSGFLTILILATYLAIHGAINIPYNGAEIGLTTTSPTSIVLVIFVIGLFTYWTINEGNPRACDTWKKIYRAYIQRHMNKKKALLVDNLLDQHQGHINEAQDIYYHGGELLLKTANTTIDGVKKYPGYSLKISKAKLCLLFMLGNLKAFFDLSVMPYVVLPLYGAIITIILLVELLHHLQLL
jgi:hypothetical protein